MNIIQQIQNQLHNLPTEKQIEVLDFVNFLHQRTQITQPSMDMAERKKTTTYRI